MLGRTFLLCCMLAWSQGAAALEVCPTLDHGANRGSLLHAAIKALPPRLMEDGAIMECPASPPTYTSLALGEPLCLYNEEIPTTVMSLSTRADNDEAIAVTYLFKYSPAMYDQALGSLTRRYHRLEPDDAAKAMIPDKTAAVFEDEGSYVSLLRIPEKQAFVILYEKAPYAGQSSRNLNDCHEAILAPPPPSSPPTLPASTTE